MLNHQEIRARIEDAWRVQPYCDACGEPTTGSPRRRRLGGVPGLAQPRGRLERALRLDFARAPHAALDRRPGRRRRLASRPARTGHALRRADPRVPPRDD